MNRICAYTSDLASPCSCHVFLRYVKAATQRVDGLLGGSFEPPGFVFFVAGAAVSGSIAILGSTLGGVTAERGSGIVWGRRSIPGSIREGGGLSGRDSKG